MKTWAFVILIWGLFFLASILTNSSLDLSGKLGSIGLLILAVSVVTWTVQILANGPPHD